MWINRVKQFLRGVTACFKHMSFEDEEFLKHNLKDEEMQLFNRLCNYDRQHCINVAKDVNELYSGEDKDKLIKVALLHDIGKSTCRLSLIDRTILVLLNKIFDEKFKDLNNKRVYVYYNHGEIGFNILKEYKYDQEFLDLIRYHHSKNIEESYKLKVLKQCDERN